jgi:hypothetical protein
MRFGIALTPVGSTHPFDDQARADLARRVADLDAIGVDDLAIFFDDLRGDMPDLAARQAEVVNFCAGLTKATSVYTCPTYYADDRILDVVFGGARRLSGRSGPPARPDVQVYWTGEEVRPRHRPAHLARVARAGAQGLPVGQLSGQ